jgi:hypothetical protein
MGHAQEKVVQLNNRDGRGVALDFTFVDSVLDENVAIYTPV